MAQTQVSDKKIDDLNKKELLSYAKELKKQLQMKEEALVSLTVNQNELKKKILIKDDMIKKTEDIQIDMLKRLKKLEKRLNETDECIYYNESDINKLNQYSRRENIEIAGIPKNIKHENLES